MRLFSSIKSQLKLMGVDPAKVRWGYPLNWRTFAVFGFHVHFLLSTTAFIYLEAQTVAEYADSFYGAVSAVGNLNVLVWNVLQMNKVLGMMGTLETVIEKRIATPASNAVYENMNTKLSKWNRIFHNIFVKTSLLSVTLPNFVKSFMLYFTTDAGENAFTLTFLARYPFNWRTPFGYLIAFIAQFGSVFCVYQFCCPVLCFYVGFCWVSISFIEDIQSELNAIGQYIAEENHNKLKRKINAIVQFHSQAKQYVDDFSEIFKFQLTSYFLWSVTTICSSLLSIQMEMAQSQGNVLTLVKPIFIITWSFGQIFLFCNFAENVTIQFEELNDTFYQCEWYAFSPEVQRMLPTIMINAQVPVIIRGFGNILCTREVFKNVANGGFSYFMVFRKMA